MIKVKDANANKKGREPTQSYHRLQFDFSEKSFDLLEKIEQLTEAKTKAEVVRNAVTAYAWLIEKVQKGETLTIPIEDLKAIVRVN